MNRTITDRHTCCLCGKEERADYDMSFMAVTPDPMLPMGWISIVASDGCRWDLCPKCAGNSLPVELAAIVLR